MLYLRTTTQFMGKKKPVERSNRQAEQIRAHARAILGQPDGPVIRQPAKRTGKGRGLNSIFNHKQRRK